MNQDTLPMRQVGEALAFSRIDLDGSELSVSPLAAGVLSETFLLCAGEENWVLKLYRIRLRDEILGDADPRMRAASRLLSIPPFFSKSKDRIEAFQQCTDLELPRILGEGVLSDGSWFTLMTKSPGLPWAPSIEQTARPNDLSTELGGLLRQLHHAELPHNHAWAKQINWADEYEALCHTFVDHFPSMIIREESQRASLRLRMDAILNEFRNCDPGPTVLCHGDFGGENILVDRSASLTGLVDFQLSCLAPEAMDFRWIEQFHAGAFLGAYGWDSKREAEARWLGTFFQMIWEGLIIVSVQRYSNFQIGALTWEQARKRLNGLLDKLQVEPQHYLQRSR